MNNHTTIAMTTTCSSSSSSSSSSSKHSRRRPRPADGITTPTHILATSPGGDDSSSSSTPNNLSLTRKMTHRAEEVVWSTVKDFMAGTVAGVAECVVGHPLDTIKTRMQGAAGGQAGGVKGVASMSAVQLLKSTVKHEGALALYRGASSRVVGSALANSVLFGANGGFKQLLNADSNQPLSSRFILASACTGAAEAAIWTPMDLLKTRCQVQYGKVVELTPWKVAKQLVKERGIRGLYTGGGPTLVREVVGNMCYFTVYMTAKQNIMRWRGIKEGDTLTFVLAGGCAGTSYWFTILPVDTVKSIVQASEVRVSGWKVTKDLYASGGIPAFYRGLTPAMLRAFPACAATWSAFEWSLKVLEKFD